MCTVRIAAVFMLVFALFERALCAEERAGVALPAGPAYSMVTAVKTKDAFAYDGKGKKDPFAPGEFVWNAERAAVHLRECKLDGIVWDDANPIIILEGNVLKKGATHLGAKVESIGRESAVFVIGDEKIVVPVALPAQGDEKNAK